MDGARAPLVHDPGVGAVSGYHGAQATRRMANDWFLRGVGELVRQNREDKGLSRAALARLAGVSESTLEAVEDGAAGSLYTIYCLARELGVPADDLLPVEVKS